MTNNFQYKITSLFLAIFVWFLAKQGIETQQRSFFAPVVFKELPANLQITSDPTSLVNISARATRRRGDVFNPSDIQVVIDLKNITTGTHPYALTKDNVIAPSNVDILNITPSQISLTIEEVIEKVLPVKARYYQGQLRDGYILSNIEIVPDRVRVRGPKSKLASLTSVSTTEVNLKDLNSSIDMIAHLDLPDKNLQALNGDIDFYIAKITVKSLPIRKRFGKVPINLRNMTYVSRVNPKSFNFFLEGPADVINNLNASQLSGTIDLENYVPGNYLLTPDPVVPKGITVLQQWPVVSLWVKPQKLSEE